jgi:hypothetical protein
LLRVALPETSTLPATREVESVACTYGVEPGGVRGAIATVRPPLPLGAEVSESDRPYVTAVEGSPNGRAAIESVSVLDTEDDIAIEFAETDKERQSGDTGVSEKLERLHPRGSAMEPPLRQISGPPELSKTLPVSAVPVKVEPKRERLPVVTAIAAAGEHVDPEGLAT